MGYWESIGSRGIRGELFLEEGEKVVVVETRRGRGEIPEGGGAVIHWLSKEEGKV
jgi:hypothetical protein